MKLRYEPTSVLPDINNIQLSTRIVDYIILVYNYLEGKDASFIYLIRQVANGKKLMVLML